MKKKIKNEETSQIESDMFKFISKVDNEIITDKFADFKIKINFLCHKFLNYL